MNEKVSDEDLQQLNKFNELINEINESTSQQQIQIFGVPNQALTKKFVIAKFPRLIYYRDENYVVYDGEQIDADSLVNWIEEFLEKKTRRLNDNSFEHDTQASTGSTTGDWFVLLYELFNFSRIYVSLLKW